MAPFFLNPPRPSSQQQEQEQQRLREFFRDHPQQNGQRKIPQQQDQHQQQYQDKMDYWKRIEEHAQERNKLRAAAAAAAAISTTDTALVGGGTHHSVLTTLTPPMASAQALVEQFATMRLVLLSDAVRTPKNSVTSRDTDSARQMRELLFAWLDREDWDIRHNMATTAAATSSTNNKNFWIRPYLLPPLPPDRNRTIHSGLTESASAGVAGDTQSAWQNWFGGGGGRRRVRGNPQQQQHKHQQQLGSTLTQSERADFFRVYRQRINNNHKEGSAAAAVASKESDNVTMSWQMEYQALLEQQTGTNKQLPGPPVDYTLQRHYTYPPLLSQPPPSYPMLSTMQELMLHWPQDEDCPYLVNNNNSDNAKKSSPESTQTTIRETLQHFDYSNPDELRMAALFRDAELPFKLYNVPDVTAASAKWTDDYVAAMFGDRSHAAGGGGSGGFVHWNENSKNDNHPEVQTPSQALVEQQKIPLARGTAQESRTNYFAFYVAKSWHVESMGVAPTRNNDWNYETWAQHARYADAVALDPTRPHFYWQAGVPPEERHMNESKWTFISRDLPSLSSSTENFFVFHVQEQKGIQCRFGERGVVAATHFDGGRNMVAMLQGAKRYILSPPNQCSKLGIFTDKRSPIYRHSLLNFGHIAHLTSSSNNSTASGMSDEERAWLERAASSQALETVLKQGEVLYIPSHWFHYIISLQKSAQCNVRSGIDQEGNLKFGGRKEVEECIDYD